MRFSKYLIAACVFTTLLSSNFVHGQGQDSVRFDMPIKCLKCNPEIGIYNGFQIIGYFDHDSSRSGTVDYMGGDDTYDGHTGTDWGLFPFAWYQMDSMYVSAVAAAPGTIHQKGDGNYDRVCSWDDPLRESWNFVTVKHFNGMQTVYGHLAKGTLTKKRIGDTVETGEYLGSIGSSGKSSYPHLHFEVRDSQGKSIDPFAGPYNEWLDESLWKNQPTYPEPPKVNWLMTGSAAPVLKSCPEQDILNKKTHFHPGDTLVCSFYISSSTAVTSPLNIEILKPDKKVWKDNSGTIRDIQNWTVSIPDNAPEGQWTYCLTYDDETFCVPFDVVPVMETAFKNIKMKDGLVKVTHYQNPFSRQVIISWNIKIAANTRLNVYNIMGKRVETLIDDYKLPGKYKTTFNAKALPSGIYYYELHIGEYKASGKLIKNR